MRNIYAVFLIGALISGSITATAQNGDTPLKHSLTGLPDDQVTRQRANNPFPFITDKIDAKYDLYLDLTDTLVIHKYGPIFKRNKLAFTGDTWDEIIVQMMNNQDPNLAKSMVTMPADDGLFIGGGKRNSENILKQLLPILNNPSKLEDFLAHIDRSKLPE
ncbi:hypothetical protein [Taibaiella soli]|uniref:Uncharacterized protein n=1 Tax=Taibaiella soli TaxID=1649169 RepID=A0A2W2BCI7_9BACT|nr:hypothetical protein [Taibaiella soli]PZF71376.1 hypothetical protein DN068_18980 [Taibaiella soli]